MRGSDDMVVMMPQKKNWQKELLAYSLYGRRKGSYEERGRAHQVSLILFFNRLRDWYMTGNMSYLSYFKEFDGKYVTFGGGAKGGRITSKGTLKTVTDESQVLLKVPRKNNMYSVDMKNIVPKESLTCLVAKDTLDESILWHRRLGHINFKTINKLVKDNLKCIKREFGILELSAKGVAERESRTLIEAARTMLANSKLPTTFWAEVVNTACYVHNKVLVVKPYNETPHELFRGRTPALSFMRQFGCHVTILNTLDHLGKFDGKSDDGFFVGYTLNSKAFRRWLENNAQDANTDVPNINTASINTGSLNINTTSPTFIIAPLKATHVDLFDDETEVDMSNITNTYQAPLTLNTRIHKEHSLEHVIGNVKSSVQTRRMTNEQGFISAVYEGKTHEDLHSCLFACFLSQEEPKKVIQALKDPSADTCSRRGGVQDSSCMAATIGCVRLIEASTPIETLKPLIKDAKAEDVDVHLYRSIMSSLMYLTSSRPDIMFAVCACARFQVTPKVLHLYAMKRIIRYLKGQPKLRLWYLKDSPFDLEAYSNSDYAGASLDMKSTIGGCQFLGSRLISWQCKKQTIVANSTTEAEYVAAANCYGQVLWI
ncbi:putative ribonuclease H-like domain-containing protein [Tanacetum coccineum]|uniref:Ribonuclease H-like domain-containing protein n=1 Tax=Tanacetum coccineum TaxID=301880 RepID=A0ABQ5GHC7_9ASTR